MDKVDIEKRMEGVRRVISEEGFMLPDGDKVISFWELASTLNNWWYAPVFVNPKLKSEDYDGRDSWAVDEYRIGDFKRGINYAVKHMKDVILVMQGYNIFYKLRENSR